MNGVGILLLKDLILYCHAQLLLSEVPLAPPTHAALARVLQGLLPKLRIDNEKQVARVKERQG